MAPPQSCVDHTRSLPEVSRTASDPAVTSQSQAGEDLVVSVIVNSTGLPAYATPRTDGVTTMSPFAHGPLGVASGVGVGDAFGRVPFAAFPGRPAGAVALGRARTGGVAGGDAPAPTGRAEGRSGPPPLPSRCEMPNTRPS